MKNLNESDRRSYVRPNQWINSSRRKNGMGKGKKATLSVENALCRGSREHINSRVDMFARTCLHRVFARTC